MEPRPLLPEPPRITSPTRAVSIGDSVEWEVTSVGPSLQGYVDLTSETMDHLILAAPGATSATIPEPTSDVVAAEVYGGAVSGAALLCEQADWVPAHSCSRFAQTSRAFSFAID